jgi:hypothetical protein
MHIRSRNKINMSKNNNTEIRLMLECVDWCFKISDLTVINFQHKCFCGYCYVRPRKSNLKSCIGSNQNAE